MIRHAWKWAAKLFVLAAFTTALVAWLRVETTALSKRVPLDPERLAENAASYQTLVQDGVKLSPEIASAWIVAGADIFSMTIDNDRARIEFDAQKGKDVLPAFHFSNWKGKRMPLPDPQVPFGVSLMDWPGSDCNLEHWSEHKSLHALSVYVNRERLRGVAKLEGLKSLELRKSGLRDSDLKELAGMRGLESLDLTCSTRITDVGLKELTGFTGLRSLNLTYTGVTGAEPNLLAGMQGLRSLILANSEFSDAGMAQVGKLEELRLLDVSYTRVSAAGLKELANLKNLQMLKIGAEQMSGASVRVLLDLDKLHLTSCAKGEKGTRPKSIHDIVSLDLSYSDVTDDGLKALSELKFLRTLNLHDSDITDAGLQRLAQTNESLRKLILGGTHSKTTAEGIAWFQRALPECAIRFE